MLYRPIKTAIIDKFTKIFQFLLRKNIARRQELGADRFPAGQEDPEIYINFVNFPPFAALCSILELTNLTEI